MYSNGHFPSQSQNESECGGFRIETATCLDPEASKPEAEVVQAQNIRYSF
jgi:hypothetical protein